MNLHFQLLEAFPDGAGFAHRIVVAQGGVTVKRAVPWLKGKEFDLIALKSPEKARGYYSFQDNAAAVGWVESRLSRGEIQCLFCSVLYFNPACLEVTIICLNRLVEHET